MDNSNNFGGGPGGDDNGVGSDGGRWLCSSNGDFDGGGSGDDGVGDVISVLVVILLMVW